MVVKNETRAMIGDDEKAREKGAIRFLDRDISEGIIEFSYAPHLEISRLEPLHVELIEIGRITVSV